MKKSAVAQDEVISIKLNKGIIKWLQAKNKNSDYRDQIRKLLSDKMKNEIRYVYKCFKTPPKGKIVISEKSFKQGDYVSSSFEPTTLKHAHLFAKEDENSLAWDFGGDDLEGQWVWDYFKWVRADWTTTKRKEK